MRYLGGKARIAKELIKIFNNYRKPDQLYVEPFVGGANIIALMDNPRLAFDKHPQLIALYKALQQGWIPPNTVTEEEYKKAKSGAYPDYLTAFIGFGCSFGGKYFAGYARSGTRNYCLNAKNSLLKQLPKIKDIQFNCKDYKELIFNNAMIYCDPPYAKTTKYTLGEFNSNEFWDTMRKWSESNIVLISEYQAPEDFECIWEKQTKTDLRGKDSNKIIRIEKIFKLK